MFNFDEYIREYEEFVEAICDTFMYNMWGCNLGTMIEKAGKMSQEPARRISPEIEIAISISLVVNQVIAEKGPRFEKFRYVNEISLRRACKKRLIQMIRIDNSSATLSSEINCNVDDYEDYLFSIKIDGTKYFDKIQERVLLMGKDKSILFEEKEDE